MSLAVTLSACAAAATLMAYGLAEVGRRLRRKAVNAPQALSRLGDALTHAWDHAAAAVLVWAARSRPPLELPEMLPGPFEPAPKPGSVAPSMVPLGDTTAIQVALVLEYTEAPGGGQ
jgi:hypothetical protein